MKEPDYDADMRIDDTALDVEWLEQPNLAMKYGKIYAEARKRLTIAEENIKVIKAELIQKANEDPVKYCNKEKPNAADIEAYYRNHRRHKEAKEEWIQAQYDCDMATAAKDNVSFSRKSALEYLVVLHGQQYFAGPSVPRNLSKERDNREEKKEKQKELDGRMATRFQRQK